jgi:hypothetical protein
VPNTTIGGATALTAARGDELPVNRAGADGRVTAADIYRASSFYVDIRDYGTVTDGGSITAALQAALDALGTHRQQRIRVPKVGAGSYTCGSINFPSGQPVILELDCTQISLTATWDIPSAYKIIGMRHLTSNFPHPYGPLPGTTITTSSGLNPIIQLVNSDNCLIEGLRVVGGGTALHVQYGALHTIRNCNFGTNTGTLPALKFDSVFWAQLDNISAEPGLTGGYAIEFTTDSNGTNLGIFICKNIIVHRNGILFRSVFGPVGVDHVEITDLHSENQVPGTSLLNFDSSLNNIGQLKFIRCSISDSVGENAYLIKNVGSSTNAIRIEGVNKVSIFDPTSDPITNLVIDNSVPSATTTSMNTSFATTLAGTEAWELWRQETPTAIDAKLMTAPVGLPWVIATPINVNQDGSTWTAVSGATITTGLPAPDGSNNAVSVSGGSGARLYNTNHTLAVGDWLIAGAWVRNPNGGSVQTSNTGLELLSSLPFPVMNDGGGGTLFGENLENRITDNGWRWCAHCYKITSLTSNPVTVRYRVGSSERHYFNPCLMLLPASTNPYDDATIVNWTRSLKGGWPSDATAGDVALLDHQKLRLGGGARIFSSAAVPSTGTGEVGDISFNSAPAAGEPLGWVCVGAGSPGTWMGLATITDANMVLAATGTGTGSFVGTTVAGTGQGVFSATGGGTTALFSGSMGNGALDLLDGETEGFAFDATTDGGTVAVIDLTNPANDLSNVALDASNISNASTSVKRVHWSDGTIHTLSSGAVAQQYDSARGVFGILVEPAATNLALRSEEFDDTSWTKTRASISADATTAPDGTFSAEELIEDSTASADHRTAHVSITTVADTTYTFSVYLKANTRTEAQVIVGDSDLSHSYRTGVFNLGTGTFNGAGSAAGSGSTFVSQASEALADGWYRVSVTGDVGSNTVSRPNVSLASGGTITYTGNGTGSIYLWGAQLELGTIATSYIQTTSAQVTRSVDELTIDSSTFPLQDAPGTLYIDAKQHVALDFAKFVLIHDGDTSDRIEIRRGSSDIVQMIVDLTATTEVNSSLGTFTAGNRHQVSMAWDTNDVDGSLDGGVVVSDGAAAMPPGLTTMQLGQRPDLTTTMTGYIYRLVYVPRQVHTDDGNLDTWRYNF